MGLLLDGEIRSATDLQKRTKAVLDKATERPVLIHREEPNDDITLVSHTLARKVFAAYELTELLHGVLQYVLGRLDKRAAIADVGYPLELEWAREFDDDDLVDFAKELAEAYRRVVTGGRPTTDVTDLVEQWRRSAVVLRDENLRGRLEQERSIIRDEVA